MSVNCISLPVVQQRNTLATHYQHVSNTVNCIDLPVVQPRNPKTKTLDKRVWQPLVTCLVTRECVLVLECVLLVATTSHVPSHKTDPYTTN